MDFAGQVKGLLFDRPWSVMVRAPLFTLLAVLFWKFQSQAVCDAAIFALLVYALFNARPGIRLWINSAGLAFAVVLVFIVATIPLSMFPALSARDFAKMLPELALVFLIPIVFYNRSRLESLLFYGAAGLTVILGYDLVRLMRELGPDVIARAHSFEPFMLNHSNVSSMAAGTAFFVLAYFAWKWRNDQGRLGLCLLGMLVNVGYKIVIASRGPQIAFVVAIGAAGILLLPGWRRKLAWVLVPVVVAGLVLMFNPRFFDKVSMKGLCDRDKVWVHSWELAKERPVLGYGFGKKVFEKVYHSSEPPVSPFHFHHTHEYWLFQLFQHGWTGLVLYVSAWGILMLRLLCCLSRQDVVEKKLLPGLIAVLLVFVHFYGLADYPDNIVKLIMLCLIPVTLVVTKCESPDGQPATSTVSKP